MRSLALVKLFALESHLPNLDGFEAMCNGDSTASCYATCDKRPRNILSFALHW